MAFPPGVTPFGGMLASTLSERPPPTPELRAAGTVLIEGGIQYKVNEAGDAWIQTSDIQGPPGDKGDIGLKGEQGDTGNPGESGSYERTLFLQSFTRPDPIPNGTIAAEGDNPVIPSVSGLAATPQDGDTPIWATLQRVNRGSTVVTYTTFRRWDGEDGTPGPKGNPGTAAEVDVDIAMIPPSFPAGETEIQAVYYLRFDRPAGSYSSANRIAISVQASRVLLTGYDSTQLSTLYQFEVNSVVANNLDTNGLLDEGDTINIDVQLLDSDGSVVFLRTIPVPVTPIVSGTGTGTRGPKGEQGEKGDPGQKGAPGTGGSVPVASESTSGTVTLARAEDVADSETDLSRVPTITRAISLVRRLIGENVRSIPEAESSHVGYPLVAVASRPGADGGWRQLGTAGYADNSITEAKLDSDARTKLNTIGQKGAPGAQGPKGDPGSGGGGGSSPGTPPREITATSPGVYALTDAETEITVILTRDGRKFRVDILRAELTSTAQAFVEDTHNVTGNIPGNMVAVNASISGNNVTLNTTGFASGLAIDAVYGSVSGARGQKGEPGSGGGGGTDQTARDAAAAAQATANAANTRANENTREVRTARSDTTTLARRVTVNETAIARNAVFGSVQATPPGVTGVDLPEFIGLSLYNKLTARTIIEIKVRVNGEPVATLNTATELAPFNGAATFEAAPGQPGNNVNVGGFLGSEGGIINLSLGAAARDNISNTAAAPQWLLIQIQYKFTGTSLATNVSADVEDRVSFGINNNSFQSLKGQKGEAGVDSAGVKGSMGDKGDRGDTGPAGAKGEMGQKGEAGTPARAFDPNTVDGISGGDVTQIDNARQTGFQGLSVWYGTKAQFDAIVTKDANTIYFYPDS